MDNHGLIGLNGVAVIVGCSRQYANHLSRRDDFPAPHAHLPTGRVWKRQPVERWTKVYRRKQEKVAAERKKRREAGLAA